MKNKLFYIYLFLLSLCFQSCNSNEPHKNPIDYEKKIITNDYKYNRITFAGSSITWGAGFLSPLSYIGEVEKHLRDNIATTIMPNLLNNNAIEISDPLSYKEKLYKYSGIDTNISGSIYGNKISIAFARERGNKGAANIELYIDGVLHDEFSTINNEFYAENIFKTFTGNGEQLAFDLGYIHTFNHSLTINGTKYNISRWPSNPKNNAMILRKINNDGFVHHFLAFENPPSKEDNIQLIFSVGETIKPVKSTISNILKEINSSIEYQYGDDTKSLITLRTNKGLDFRQTDKRAIKTWKFNRSKNRYFTFKIKELSPNATGDTPEFFLNFITNHMYYFQNAGIGASTAEDLLKANNTLRTTTQINNFKPDLILLESSTNDDWRLINKDGTPTDLGNYWMAYDGIKMNTMFNYIPAEISEYSIKLDSNATYGNIKKGDILIIGKGEDNRALEVRIIESWNPINKIATFNKSLSINDYNGSFGQIKRIDYWAKNIKSFFRELDNNPDIMIATSGVPNIHDRRLEGYREKGQELARTLNAHFIDFYQVTYDWKYGNPLHIIDNTWSEDNTHPNKKGNELFGSAIIKTLSQIIPIK